MKNRRVFVLAPSERFSTRNLAAFGTVIYLFSDARDLNPMHGQGAIVKLVERLRALDFDNSADSIALTGPVASVAFLLLAASECSENGNVSTLIFDARAQGEYRQRTLEPQHA